MRLVGAAAGGASQQALEVAEAAAPAVLVHAHRLLVAQVKARRRGGSIST
jgi:hypothetical protein